MQHNLNLSKKIIQIFIIFSLFAAFRENCEAQLNLNLVEAQKLATENSPDIKRIGYDMERNSELLKARLAANKSNFSLSLNPLSYSENLTFNSFLSAWSENETKESFGTFRISQPIEKTGGTLSLINRFSWQDSYSDYQDIRNKQFSNNLYLSFTQPIWTYNTITLETRQLELNLEQTELNYSIQKLLLEKQVAQSFYSAYEYKMSLEIALEEQKNQEASYQLIKNKVDADLAAREELYQAELNLSSSNSTAANAQVQLENAYDDLKILLGLALNDDIAVEADLSYRDVEVDLSKAISYGLDKRMELRQREIDIQNAQMDLTETEAQNEFKGQVLLDVGLIGTDENLGNIYDTPTQNKTVSLSVEIPLWDWGETASRIKAAEADIKKGQLSYDDEVNSIVLEIRKSYRNLSNLRNQIVIAEQNVRNAELTYEINREKYEYGDLTSMDLSLYQTQLSQKRIDLVSAQVDYKLALLDLKIQSLWDFEKNEPVIK